MSRLRPYQEKTIADVEAVFRQGARAVCLQMPTGGGKSRSAAELLLRETNAGCTGLFLAHLDTLLDDTHARLAEAGVWAGFVQAGR
jgi:superfamily II DNA or RNA helicase